MPKICPFSARSQTALCLALSGASSRSQPESAHTKARRAEVKDSVIFVEVVALLLGHRLSYCEWDICYRQAWRCGLEWVCPSRMRRKRRAEGWGVVQRTGFASGDFRLPGSAGQLLFGVSTTRRTTITLSISTWSKSIEGTADGEICARHLSYNIHCVPTVPKSSLGVIPGQLPKRHFENNKK